MPYIAFELDALKRVPAAARSAGVPEADLGFGLVRLWEHCWSEKTDHVEAAHLAGFFGGDRGQVTEALSAFRFLEADNTGFRVKGADRYLRLHLGQKKGGRKAKSNLIPGPHKGKSPENSAGGQPEGGAGESLRLSSGSLPALVPEKSSGSLPALTPNTEHRTPNTKDLLSRAPSVSLVPDADEAERQMSPDETGAYPSTGLGFCGWWPAAKKQAGMTAEVFNVAETAQWADRCFAEVGERFWIAADDYLHDEYWRRKGCPLSVFRRDDDVGWRLRANEAAS